MHEGRRVKEFQVTGNLNIPNTKMIMDNITPHIEMRTKVIYSFKAEIHRGTGEIMNYSKPLTSPPGMFTVWRRFKHILRNMNKNGWIWIAKKYGQKLIYPPQEQLRHEAFNESKLIFRHVQIRLVASNKPLMSCGPLPDW